MAGTGEGEDGEADGTWDGEEEEAEGFWRRVPMGHDLFLERRCGTGGSARLGTEAHLHALLVGDAGAVGERMISELLVGVKSALVN